jgi:hypothetical protein
MQDTSFSARPDSFPAASPALAQPWQHETDAPRPLATIWFIRSEAGLGLRDTGTKPRCSSH